MYAFDPACTANTNEERDTNANLLDIVVGGCLECWTMVLMGRSIQEYRTNRTRPEDRSDLSVALTRWHSRHLRKGDRGPLART